VMTLFGGGLYAKTYLSIHEAANAGARFGSAGSRSATTDNSLLLEMRKPLSGVPRNNIERIVVYGTFEPDGPPGKGCMDTPVVDHAGPGGDECTVYSSKDLYTDFGKPLDELGIKWKAGSRNVNRDAKKAQYLGVCVRADSGALGLFGKPTLVTSCKTVPIESSFS